MDTEYDRDDHDDTLLDDRLESQRETIRQSLDAIANDIGMALRDIGLTFPVFLTVPNSGLSLVTFATPIDPTDEDWSRATEIVCQAIEGRIGASKLRGAALQCAMARATMSAADVTAD
jgi:hypothetical protein